MKNWRLEPGDNLLFVIKGVFPKKVFNRVREIIKNWLNDILTVRSRPLSPKDCSEVPYLQITSKDGKKEEFLIEIGIDSSTPTTDWLFRNLESLIAERKLENLKPEPLKKFRR